MTTPADNMMPPPDDSASILVAEAPDGDIHSSLAARLTLPLHLLAFIGAATFAILAWIPWANVLEGSAGSNLQLQRVTITLDPGSLGFPPFTERLDPYTLLFAWSLFTLLGLFLSPIIWRHVNVFARRALLGAYVLWLALASVFILAYAVLPFSVPNPQYVTAGRYTIQLIGGERLVIVSLDLAGGWYLAVFALALAWAIPVIPLVVPALRHASHVSATRATTAADAIEGEQQPEREPERASIAMNTQPVRGLRAGPAVSAFTLGVLGWAAGVFLMPWATLNCSGNPLLVSTCLGVSYNTSVALGVRAHSTVFDPLVALYVPQLLLAPVVVLFLVALWRRRASVALCVWLTFWLVLATFFAILASAGVGVLITHSHIDNLISTVGSWSATGAAFVTFASLLLCLIGLIPLWISTVRHIRQK